MLDGLVRLVGTVGTVGTGRHGCGERFERRALGRLDVADHLGEQPGLRAEVVHEHPMAGAEVAGELAQAEPGHPVVGQVLDHAGQQLLAGVGAGAGHRAAR